MKVIIVGGGFAGVNLALSLAHNIKFQVTLVDKNDYHFFTPFLYQLIPGNLKSDSTNFPFLKLFLGKENLKFHRGELVEVKTFENKIILADDVLEYEYLILATGSITQFYGRKNIAEKAFGLKTMEDVLTLKRHVIKHFECAGLNDNLKFVVAGGGSGGVEAAVMLAELLADIQINYTLPNLQPQIYLIEKRDSLLPAMSLKSQQKAYNDLTALGIKVLLDRSVEDYSDGAVLLSSGEPIETATLIWAAGIKASKFDGFFSEAYHADDRLIVDAYNKVEGTYNVFAIGDVCIQKDPENFPDGYPQMMQVAIQQGENLAENFQLMAERRALKAFVYKDMGISVKTGKTKAITVLNKPAIHFQNKAAWFIRLFWHLRPTMQEGNRLKLLYSGLYGYFGKRKFFNGRIDKLK